MRIVTPEYLEKLKNGNSAYATIINTPRPDFTELHRQSKEFEKWILAQQRKEKKIMQEALEDARKRGKI
ncbi:MAG: hypothetical protein K6A43_01455 [Treponema sp.]|nr:hypothetical protein [Treponema sp.]